MDQVYIRSRTRPAPAEAPAEAASNNGDQEPSPSHRRQWYVTVRVNNLDEAQLIPSTYLWINYLGAGQSNFFIDDTNFV